MADGTSSEAEVTAFLDELRDTALIHNFIENLGQDLVSTGVLREAEFGKRPGMLQLAKLKIRFKQSGIQVGDIPTTAEWAEKKMDWWEQHGAKLILRVQDKWKSQAAGVGAVSESGCVPLVRGRCVRDERGS